jgi:glc operon protein GlcG
MIKIAEAEAAIEKIVAATIEAGYVVAIAIVDENGDLVAAYRMDGSRPRWMRASLRKAYTSCVMDRTTTAFHDEIVRRGLQIGYYGDPLFTALAGGIPVVGPDGTTIGGIGVTGPTQGRDEELAAAGLPYLQPEPPGAESNQVP